jgi:hypothetical protein
MSRRSLIGLLIVLWVVTAVPYIYGHAIASTDRVYTGLLVDVPDHAQYWSWVRESRDALFIRNTMTPEGNPPIFMNTMMWLLARVQSAFALSFPALFQVWRLAALLALVSSLSWFLQEVVADRATRRTAFWLALLGSGFGWVLIAGKVALHLPDAPFPTDIYTAEPNTFLGLLAYPYFPLAQSCVLLACIGAWRAYVHADSRGIALAGAAAFVGTALHAYDLLVMAAALASLFVVAWLRDRQFPARLFAACATAGVCGAPVALYYTRLTAGDPLWQSILGQYANAGVWSPPHVHLIVLMGLPLVLAAAAVLTRTVPDAGAAFAAGWAVTGLGLIYIPTVFQIKMLAAWQFPLAILAAHYWHRQVLTRTWFAERQGMARLATVALIAFASLTNVYLYIWRLTELRHRETPYFLHIDESNTLDWLSVHTSGTDVLLAPETVGRFVPGLGHTRSYLAHWAMTNRYFERRDNVQRFFQADTDNNWREALLRREGVTLVLDTSFQQPSAAAALDRASWLELVRATPTVRVYRVRSTAIDSANPSRSPQS